MKKISDLTILVAEDNDFERNLIARMLGEMGVVNILHATSGDIALQLLAENAAIDVVLCDLKMPDTDGVQLLRRIATDWPEVAVIIISVLDERLRGSVERMAREKSVRIAGNIGKPVTPDKLRPLLEALDEAVPAALLESPAAAWPRITTQDVRIGLDKSEFYLEFQPVVEVASMEPVGAEALVRWNNSEHGIIPPDAFIPVAEMSDIIDEFTLMVIDQAINACSLWKQAGLNYRVSVNVSARTLRALDLPERIQSLLTSHALSPDQIILEVTESGFMEELAKTLDVSSRLRIRDIALSIDDFGTGYSSLQQLQRIPFSELKIDRSFLAATTEARVILEAGIRLGRELGLATVVEGVETQDDWDRVRGLGADIAQGYFIARPMPAADVPTWHEDWTRRHKQ